MQTEKKTTYAEAMKRLEEIAAKMEDNELQDRKYDYHAIHLRC